MVDFRIKTGQETDILTRQNFISYLRSSLNHLYDPEVLRRSPLVALFALEDEFDPALALQQILSNAIHRLKSLAAGQTSEGNQRAQRLYSILLFRYIQKLTQEEVANQFSTSDRQLRREQGQAIELLAATLWESYHLQDLSRLTSQGAQSRHLPEQPVTNQAEDMAWLKPDDEPTDPTPILQTVYHLAQPLCERYGVHFETDIAPWLPGLAVHPTALRQILLSLLTPIIRLSGDHTIHLRAYAIQNEVVFEIFSSEANFQAVESTLKKSSTTLKLIELSNGSLETLAEGEKPLVRLRLPYTAKLTVLVVDDNSDIQGLLSRFAQGTRYRLVSMTDPRDVFAQIDLERPHLIVLDVMMPGLDGWDLLEQIQRRPASAGIPVIICTILEQEELSITLGASGFIAKPVTREAFLKTLDQVAAMLDGK